MDEEPLLRVLKGTPTPEELAALVGALATRSTSADSRSAQVGVSRWAAGGRTFPSWKASGRPR